MIILRSSQPGPKDGVVATIGNFDGVHSGHQALLKDLKQRAADLGLPSLVLLFEPQPGEFFCSAQAPARLSTLREKIEIMTDLGINYVCCMRFNTSLSQLDSPEFVTRILKNQLKAHTVMVGTDFRFGAQRQGNFDQLKILGNAAGIKVEAFPDFNINEGRVSSTRIREALAQGSLARAARDLGRPFSMEGRVIHGDGRGRQLGVPTANIAPKRINLPLRGVFLAHVVLPDGRIHYGVANLGKRPTVDGSKNSLEIHLLDWQESLYYQHLKVIFLHKLRDEIKFPSLDALIAQIRTDIYNARSLMHSGEINLTTDE